MDPSIVKCQYTDSFIKQPDVPIVLHTYSSSENYTVKTLELSYPNHDDRKNIKDNRNIRDNVNDINGDPFKTVSVKPFMNRDAIILANIDTIFNFSKHTSGYVLMQETKEFNFATMNDGPGGFTEYIFFRNPNSYGYGITPKTKDFNKNLLDLTRFNITYGETGEGDLKKDYKSFIGFVRKAEAVGVDLIINNTHNNNIGYEDYMVALMTALGIIKIGGTFVSKVQLNGDMDVMTDLLFITSQCFNTITLFKPLSTDINDNIYYIVCEDARRNNIEWISYLEDSYQKVSKDNAKIKSLVGVPSNFLKWIKTYLHLIGEYKNRIRNIPRPIYDTYKCKAIWNLPS
jgi:hypothetical protein